MVPLLWWGFTFNKWISPAKGADWAYDWGMGGSKVSRGGGNHLYSFMNLGGLLLLGPMSGFGIEGQINCDFEVGEVKVMALGFGLFKCFLALQYPVWNFLKR